MVYLWHGEPCSAWFKTVASKCRALKNGGKHQQPKALPCFVTQTECPLAIPCP